MKYICEKQCGFFILLGSFPSDKLLIQLLLKCNAIITVITMKTALLGAVFMSFMSMPASYRLITCMADWDK
ncbi:MAG: hypothetical protein CSYNP_03975 [Syntrophus sp. SKADARSKE-3]|nr:hypothetical protein [Syntrophus sp. SKADARSKE-3]